MQAGYYPAPHDVPANGLGRGFAGSLVIHGIVAAALLLSGLWKLNKNQFGSPSTNTGSVGVDVVKTIPIPRKEGPINPLANDSTSLAPQLPAPEARPKKQVVEEPKDAIPVPNKFDKPKKSAPKQPITSLFRPPEAYKNNQVYSSLPQAANSPLYAMQGANGIDMGKESVLGERFGAYADLMRQRISQHWNRSNLHSLPSQKCTITFSIARDGTVSNVQVSDPSGDYLLDTSAKRAILDANPLPALPQQFDRNQATVELSFQLRQ